MYIEPNTTVYVCRNIPWTNSYEHTVAFVNQQAQLSYLLQNAIQTVTTNYYQREKRDYIRMKMPVGTAESCNYIAWQNTSFPITPNGSDARWFFAFITGVEYINNEVTEITYEIDVMQTFFLFRTDPTTYFVERETPATDVAGQNLVPEHLEVGDYINNNIITSEDFGSGMSLRDWSIVVACTFNNDTNLSNARGGFYAGTFSGVKYISFTDPVACADFLASAVERNKVTGVVNVFMMPTNYITESTEFSTATYKAFTYDASPTTVDGYTPRNKKLLTYPYSFIVASNNNGNAAEFKFERFTGNSIVFALIGSMNCNPQIALIPTNYDGFGSAITEPASLALSDIANMDEKLTVQGFPQCSFSADSFKAWLAQNSFGLALNLGSGIATTAMGALTGRVFTATSGARQVAGLLGEGLQHMTLPPQAKGTDTAGVLACMRRLDFTIMTRQITAEFARIIDNYFDRYGYATNRLKTLNLLARPHWTYIKTVSADVHGQYGNDYARRIDNILDNGITFWRVPSEVGLYQLNNSPT